MTTAVTEEPLNIAFRRSRPGDEPALYSAFLRGFRQSSFAEGLNDEVFFFVARKCWICVMEFWTITVAHPDGHDDELAGFIAWKAHEGKRSVAWLYVPYRYRRLGIATKLLAEAGITPAVPFDAVFASPHALKLFRERGFRARFVPYRSWELL